MYDVLEMHFPLYRQGYVVVTLTTFKMYQFIIYFYASFRGRLDLKFYFDMATLALTWRPHSKFLAVIEYCCSGVCIKFVVPLPPLLPVTGVFICYYGDLYYVCVCSSISIYLFKKLYVCHQE